MIAMFLAYGTELHLDISVKYDATEIAVFVSCHPMQREMTVIPKDTFVPIDPKGFPHIAKFRKSTVFSEGDYAVYELVNGPPTGWSWIVTHGKLRAIRSIPVSKGVLE